MSRSIGFGDRRGRLVPVDICDVLLVAEEDKGSLGGLNEIRGECSLGEGSLGEASWKVEEEVVDSLGVDEDGSREKGAVGSRDQLYGRGVWEGRRLRSGEESDGD